MAEQAIYDPYQEEAPAVFDPYQQDNAGSSRVNSQDSSIVGRLGLGGSSTAQFAAGAANMSPLGMGAAAYNLMRSIPEKGIAHNLLQLMRGAPGGQEFLNMAEATKNLPAIPPFGQGGAYTAGEAAGLALDLGAGAVSLGGKALKAIRPQKIADELTSYIKTIKDTSENNAGNTVSNIHDLAKDTAISYENKANNIGDTLLNSITRGKTRLENAEEFGNEIKNNYKIQKDLGAQNYKDNIGKFSNKLMYSTKDMPSEAEKLFKTSEFNIKPEGKSQREIFEEYGKYLGAKTELEFSRASDVAREGIPDVVKKANLPGVLQNKFRQFTTNPTFENAHRFQSQVGYEVRDLQKSNARGLLDLEGKEHLSKLQDFRDTLKNIFNERFNKIDNTGDLANKFNNSTKYWAENVAPYERNPLIAEIAKSFRKVNPAKIMSGMNNILKSNDIDTLSSHIGDNFNKYVLANELGKKASLSPERLLDSINGLETKGLDIYKTDEINKITPLLEQSIKNKSLTGDLAKKLLSSKNTGKIAENIQDSQSDYKEYMPGITEHLEQLTKYPIVKEISNRILSAKNNPKKIMENISGIDNFINKIGNEQSVLDHIPGLEKQLSNLEQNLRYKSYLKKGAGAAAALTGTSALAALGYKLTI
jgi:polyhydroxyalkanoate synthesis regulator phasin